MAPDYGVDAGRETPTEPLADRETEDRASEDKQSSEQPERNIIPESTENTRFFL